MRRVDLAATPLERDPADPPGYRARFAQLAPLLGAEKIGGTVYELDPGDASCPYHYELGNEEWLLVLAGEVVVRHPEGETTLATGAVACFPDGPAGAHKLANRGPGPARVLMLSTRVRPAGWGYPDSGKVAFSAPGEWLVFRRDAAVDYWDGETGPGPARA